MILESDVPVRHNPGMSKRLFDRPSRDAARDRMIAALPVTSKLRSRIMSCGRDDIWTGNIWSCRTAGCPRCRWNYMRGQQRQAQQRFANADRADMSMLTICFDVASGPDEIGEGWIRARRQITNLVTAMRRQSQRWRSFNMVGFLEADPFVAADICLMGSDQQTMIPRLSIPFSPYSGAPAWLWHIHAIVHHPRLDWQAVRDAFQRRWNQPFQVEVENFYTTQPKEKSIDKIVAYSLKYEPGRLLGNAVDYWPSRWMADYYQWAFDFSHSYKSFRFSVGARREGNRQLGVKSHCKGSISSNGIHYTDCSHGFGHDAA